MLPRINGYSTLIPHKQNPMVEIAHQIVVNIQEPPLHITDVNRSTIRACVKGTDTSLSVNLKPQQATITVYKSHNFIKKKVTQYQSTSQLISELKDFIQGDLYE